MYFMGPEKVLIIFRGTVLPSNHPLKIITTHMVVASTFLAILTPAFALTVYSVPG